MSTAYSRRLPPLQHYKVRAQRKCDKAIPLLIYHDRRSFDCRGGKACASRSLHGGINQQGDTGSVHCLETQRETKGLCKSNTTFPLSDHRVHYLPLRFYGGVTPPWQTTLVVTYNAMRHKDRVISTLRNSSYVVKKSVQMPKIDARGLIEKYKNFVWAKDIHLSKLSPCEIGLKRTTGDYNEVCSVPLP